MDPVQTLLADLKSTDPFIRFSVLSRVETMEWNPEQINSFQALLLAETDEGVIFHLQKILAHIERKQGGIQFDEENALFEIDQILSNPSRDNLALALLLESVKKTHASEIAQRLREANWQSFAPEVIPFILGFFKRNGSAADVPIIEKFCSHKDPRIVAAAIEVLEKLSEDKLKEYIVPLLLNPIHGIRSRAVRLLYRWDPQEALKHFESMLFSEELRERQAALFHAFFFPFEVIEPLMLKFLALENDSALVERAGYLFRANPAPEEPIRLVEVALASGGVRRKLIEEILLGVIDSLRQVGLLDKDQKEYLVELKKEIVRRKNTQIVNQSEEALTSQDSVARKRAAINLSELAKSGNSEAMPILQKHLGVESDGQIKNLIEREVKPPDSKKVPESFEGFSLEQRLEFFSALDLAGLKKIRPLLKDFLRGKLSNEEKLAIIRVFARSGEKADSQFLQFFINDPVPEILSAAIEALGKIDPDYIFPYLPKFIRHASDEVRLAAIQAFALFDKRQAISLVEKMAVSLQPRQRQMAIFCASHFDFPSIHDLSISILKNESDQENLKQIIALLKANLDNDLVYEVFVILKGSSGKKAEMLNELLRLAFQKLALENRNAISYDKQMENFEIKFSEETARQKKPLPSYSLKNIQDLRKKQAAETGSNENTSFIQFCILAIGTGVMLVALIWYVFLSGESPLKRAGITKNEFDGSTRKISGLIVYLDTYGRGFLVQENTSNSDYFVFFRSQPSKTFKKGDQFNGEIKPYKRDKKTILSELVNWN
ncbi:MAG: HEAT repeat domain-containing protein [Candidatus Riflebacteria bacterium]|nr:HEAT repeat domain-containing protein [Candidatus Riflebacteria bacterium]